ncbi:restriction endonuclease [Psychromicrobium xiongbiense]|uniref:restriction endonuclease n=1 Tax=Psychromicrobium xiongbiense TaxID=3051184 RepID=UPI002552FD0B|nr:restriction endonuclease [Psychromicrobium sp. YIM S02556]
MASKQIQPALLKPLKDALAKLYWYKNDLKEFLICAVPVPALTSAIDGTLSKREFSSNFVMALYNDQHRYFDELLGLILAVSDIVDPNWLKALDDDDFKYSEAVVALENFRTQAAPYRDWQTETEKIWARAEQQRKMAERRREHSEALIDLRTRFGSLHGLESQKRGYELEKFLPRLFHLFEIDARGGFRIEGEQIDGAFTLEGTDYLIEAKWRAALTPLADISVFKAKVEGKLDNTLGLFLSMNGFQPTAVEKLNGQDRSKVILMDGRDLMAILDERLALPAMITRKRQHAAHTGEVYLSAWEVD